VGAIAFGAGYLIGTANQPSPTAASSSAEPVVLAGTVSYSSASGEVLGDAGAVVIAIPEGRFPSPKWPTSGLAPRDPEAATGSVAMMALEEFGASYTRADEEGKFSLGIKPGRYHLLFVSRNADRPSDSPITEQELNRLRQYFSPAPQLVGNSKHHWLVADLSSGELATRSHDFGADGG
jgi:hypothetical protein